MFAVFWIFCGLLIGQSQELRIAKKPNKLKILSAKNYLHFYTSDSQSTEIISIQGFLKSSSADSIKILTSNFRADSEEYGRNFYNGFNANTPQWELTVAKSDVNTITVFRSEEALKRREFALVVGIPLLFTGFATAATAFAVPDDDSRRILYLLSAAEALVGFGLVIPLSKRVYHFGKNGNARFTGFE